VYKRQKETYEICQKEGKEKEEDHEEKESVLMSERKDVEVHVTGVSMSGAVKDDNKRSAPTDQKKSGKKTAGNS
jgi:hypothetical protein